MTIISSIRYWFHCRTHKPDYAVKWPELPVGHLIIFRDNPDDGAFIVFVDYVGDIDWFRDDKSEETAKRKESEGHISEVQNEVAGLEPRIRNWPIDLKVSAKIMLGEALARAFQCEHGNALQALKKASTFIDNKSAEVSRYWTLRACACSATLAGALGVLAMWQKAILIQVFGPTPYLLFLATCAGALGALLSIILRIGSLSFDVGAERRLHYVEGSMRIVAGGIAGILAGALVKLGVFLPFLSQAGFTTTAVCATALIAGASERFVPTIIARMDSSDIQGNGGKK